MKLSLHSCNDAVTCITVHGAARHRELNESTQRVQTYAKTASPIANTSIEREKI